MRGIKNKHICFLKCKKWKYSCFNANSVERQKSWILDLQYLEHDQE